MNIVLNAEEIRVLGCLVVKEVTTPDYYPMTLNALVNACNQKSCRDPLVKYDEGLVSVALDTLRLKQLASLFSGSESRVVKHKQRLTELFFFTEAERAVLCELMLRGPQTPGELRNRAERMHPFAAGLQDVEATLKELETRPDGPWVKALPRQPGRKEIRFAHLLGGEPAVGTTEAPVESAAPSDSLPGTMERLQQLENTVALLQKEFGELKDKLAPLFAEPAAPPPPAPPG